MQRATRVGMVIRVCGDGNKAMQMVIQGFGDSDGYGVLFLGNRGKGGLTSFAFSNANAD